MMTPQQINVKLQTMKGKSFLYGNNIHIVKSFTISNDSQDFKLITDRDKFKRTFSQAEAFFKTWFETKENLAIDAAKQHLSVGDTGTETTPAATNGSDIPVIFINTQQTDMLANELVKILKENIEKVSKNPNYIKQAQAIDKSVSTILNVKRLQLDMFKTVNSKK